jgi:hypothetical protein
MKRAKPRCAHITVCLSQQPMWAYSTTSGRVTRRIYPARPTCVCVRCGAVIQETNQ